MFQIEGVAQAYLAGLLSEEDLLRKLQAERKSTQKTEGAVYTPRWIVDAMISRARITSPAQRIIEPSCGHGAFILPLIEHARETFGLDWGEALQWLQDQVVAVDIDPIVVDDLRLILSLFFRRKGVSCVPEDFHSVLTHDGLKVDLTGFDVAIGNPPYVRNRLIDPGYKEWLRGNFEVARKGNIDLYHIFLDRYMRAVPRCVFIVPHGCIKTSSASLMRSRVFPLLDEIVDFGSTLVFPGIRTYTCILASSASHSGPCTFRSDVGDPGRLVGWRSLTGEGMHEAPRIALSGVATLADDVFLLRKDRISGSVVGMRKGKTFEIEQGILRPFYKTTKLGSYNLDDPDQFILHPYRGRAIMPEDELEKKYPGAYAYLSACRGRLAERDKRKTERYPAWYAYGRTQGLHDLSSREIVFIPRLIGGNVSPLPFDTTSVTERYGSPMFQAGFVVAGTQEARDALCSDVFLSFVERNGFPKPGKGTTYYAISSKHVNAFLLEELGQDAASSLKL